MKRRDFIINSAAAGLFFSSPLLLKSCSTRKPKVLILGGTFFVGPAIVNAFKNQDHEITLFNRGITNPGLFPDLRLIKGDRETGPSAYDSLIEESWDVVIDVWPEKSNLVDEATRALKNNTKHYIFISSIAVYNDFQEVGLNESSEVVSLDLDKADWGYSEEKTAAENFVRDRFPENHTILRPGAIKGWRDPALDMLYWCIKLNNAEEILAPGTGNDPLQFVDVTDVGGFSQFAFENNLTGTYNCVGPPQALLWQEFLETGKNHFNSNAELFWPGETFLSENEVSSFVDLPLWAPLSEDRGFMQISNKKLLDSGYSLVPITNTLNDCMAWHKSQGNIVPDFGSEKTGLGLSSENETHLIQKLKLQQLQE